MTWQALALFMSLENVLASGVGLPAFTFSSVLAKDRGIIFLLFSSIVEHVVILLRLKSYLLLVFDLKLLLFKRHTIIIPSLLLVGSYSLLKTH